MIAALQQAQGTHDYGLPRGAVHAHVRANGLRLQVRCWAAKDRGVAIGEGGGILQQRALGKVLHHVAQRARAGPAAQRRGARAHQAASKDHVLPLLLWRRGGARAQGCDTQKKRLCFFLYVCRPPVAPVSTVAAEEHDP